MTEKRYYAHKHLLHENEVHDKICHNFMSLDETVEHMNNQYWKYKQLKEENEQLKQSYIQLEHRHSLLHDVCVDAECDRDSYHKDVLSLEKENEQLKSTINTLTHDNTKMKKVLNTTKKENEHIKNTIQEAYETERTDLGKSVLKQLMEAIQ